MSLESNFIAYGKRKTKYDEPLSPDFTDADLAYVLQQEPFTWLAKESSHIQDKLKLLIKNDTIIEKFQANTLIYEAGEYANYAYLILSGTLGLAKPKKNLAKRKKIGLLKKIKVLWQKKSSYPEVRANKSNSLLTVKPKTIKLEDYSKIDYQENFGFFGEISALRRDKRTLSAFAKDKLTVLKLRPGALRELCRLNLQIKQAVFNSYKNNFSQLEDFANLPIKILSDFKENAKFFIYGDDEWQKQYKQAAKDSSLKVLKTEELIIEANDYINNLIIINSGFCRVTKIENEVETTVGVLGKNSFFGLNEILAGKDCYSYNLRAIGYVDLFKIPSQVVSLALKPYKAQANYLQNLNTMLAPKNVNKQNQLEFLVDHRFNYGTSTMVIDLTKCVRCDDCVKACATLHDNNPRFIRNGYKYGNYLVANACMHCADPVCMIGCPTNAIHRLPTGVVKINPDTCIGCSTCANNCPYNNIQMISIRDKWGNLIMDAKTGLNVTQATKCDLCDNVADNPICVRACSHGALKRIDFSKLDNFLE